MEKVDLGKQRIVHVDLHTDLSSAWFIAYTKDGEILGEGYVEEVGTYTLMSYEVATLNGSCSYTYPDPLTFPTLAEALQQLWADHFGLTDIVMVEVDGNLVDYAKAHPHQVVVARRPNWVMGAYYMELGGQTFRVAWLAPSPGKVAGQFTGYAQGNQCDLSITMPCQNRQEFARLFVRFMANASVFLMDGTLCPTVPDMSTDVPAAA